MIKLIECPRDAMQGLEGFIPSLDKIKYLNTLLKVGFDTLDFGSFVSPRAVPQMKDTSEVLEGLELENSATRLLAIIANLRGARDASEHEEITYLGFPLSVSETFQKRNTNQNLDQAFTVVEEIQSVCLSANKELVVYLSMGFGNPYGDPYSPQTVVDFTGRLSEMGVSVISLSDTVGSASNSLITQLFESLNKHFTDIEFGVHLHARRDQSYERIEAAYRAGCRRFDSAIRGFGGCPMAKDELVGNVSTETVIQLMDNEQEELIIDRKAFSEALAASVHVFG